MIVSFGKELDDFNPRGNFVSVLESRICAACGAPHPDFHALPEFDRFALCLRCFGQPMLVAKNFITILSTFGPFRCSECHIEKLSPHRKYCTGDTPPTVCEACHAANAFVLRRRRACNRASFWQHKPSLAFNPRQDIIGNFEPVVSRHLLAEVLSPGELGECQTLLPPDIWLLVAGYTRLFRFDNTGPNEWLKLLPSLEFSLHLGSLRGWTMITALYAFLGDARFVLNCEKNGPRDGEVWVVKSIPHTRRYGLSFAFCLS